VMLRIEPRVYVYKAGAVPLSHIPTLLFLNFFEISRLCG
jgi:hypothetical protein